MDKRLAVLRVRMLSDAAISSAQADWDGGRVVCPQCGTKLEKKGKKKRKLETRGGLVVEARLKGSGMHWTEMHVNPMLALRTIICSDRWKEEWPKIETHLRQQTRQRRVQLHQSRLPALPTPTPTGHVPSLDAALLASLTAWAEQENSPGKPKSNPWRNFKHGKALYQRPLPPKF